MSASRHTEERCPRCDSLMEPCSSGWTCPTCPDIEEKDGIMQFNSVTGVGCQ